MAGPRGRGEGGESRGAPSSVRPAPSAGSGSPSPSSAATAQGTARRRQLPSRQRPRARRARRRGGARLPVGRSGPVLSALSWKELASPRRFHSLRTSRAGGGRGDGLPARPPGGTALLGKDGPGAPPPKPGEDAAFTHRREWLRAWVAARGGGGVLWELQVRLAPTKQGAPVACSGVEGGGGTRGSRRPWTASSSRQGASEGVRSAGQPRLAPEAQRQVLAFSSQAGSLTSGLGNQRCLCARAPPDCQQKGVCLPVVRWVAMEAPRLRHCLACSIRESSFSPHLLLPGRNLPPSLQRDLEAGQMGWGGLF